MKKILALLLALAAPVTAYGTGSTRYIEADIWRDPLRTKTWTPPAATDTLVGRASTDTLTNKTLTSPTIATILNIGTLTLPTSTDTLVGRATTDTLTNKTIAAGSNTITGLTDTNLSGSAAIGNPNLASMAQATVKGRASGAGTGTPSDLSGTQLNTITGLNDLALTKAFAITDTTDTSTGNIDALTSANISSVRLTGAAPVLRGITAPSTGQLLVVMNASGADVVVRNQDSTPTAANRIITGTGADATLKDTAAFLLKYDLTTARWRIIGGSGGSSSGDAMALAATQTAHGFSVGNAVYYTGSAWAKAKCDVASTCEALGIVTAVPTANTFTLTLGGNTGAVLSGLTAGQVYYVSDVTAGNTSTVEPTTVGEVSKPIMVAYASDSAVVLNMRGQVITAATVGGDNCHVSLYGSSIGVGATNTLIALFSSSDSYGSCMTGTNDASAGSSITMNTAGTYRCTVNMAKSSGAAIFGLSYNDSALSTGITSSSWAQGYRCEAYSAGTNQMEACSFGQYMPAGSVVRVKEDTSFTSSSTIQVFNCSREN